MTARKCRYRCRRFRLTRTKGRRAAPRANQPRSIEARMRPTRSCDQLAADRSVTQFEVNETWQSEEYPGKDDHRAIRTAAGKICLIISFNHHNHHHYHYHHVCSAMFALTVCVSLCVRFTFVNIISIYRFLLYLASPSLCV